MIRKSLSQKRLKSKELYSSVVHATQINIDMKFTFFFFLNLLNKVSIYIKLNFHIQIRFKKKLKN